MKKLLLPMIAMSTAVFAADAAPAPSASGQSMWQTVIMIGVALVFFYFILWRPEQKRRKAMQKQREAMKKGDRVTAMGIVGTLYKINDNTVVLKNIDGSKIEVIKAAITDVQPGTEEDARKAEKEEGKRVDFTDEPR